jgi:hypothetical protein
MIKRTKHRTQCFQSFTNTHTGTDTYFPSKAGGGGKTEFEFRLRQLILSSLLQPPSCFRTNVPLFYFSGISSLGQRRLTLVAKGSPSESPTRGAFLLRCVNRDQKGRTDEQNGAVRETFRKEVFCVERSGNPGRNLRGRWI